MITKNHQTVKFSIFEDTMKTLGVEPSELCVELGYARNAHGHWRKTGNMPKVASLACEGLCRRWKNNTYRNQFFTVIVPMEQAELLKTFVMAIDGSFTEIDLNEMKEG